MFIYTIIKECCVCIGVYDHHVGIILENLRNLTLLSEKTLSSDSDLRSAKLNLFICKLTY